MLKLAPLAIGLVLYAAGYPVPKNGQCPSGYRDSGACAPMSPNAPHAYPKGDRPCASGYMQSGNYCLEIINDPSLRRRSSIS